MIAHFRTLQQLGIATAVVGAMALGGCGSAAPEDLDSAQNDSRSGAKCPSAVISPDQSQSLSARMLQLEDAEAIQELKAQYGNTLDAVVKDPSKVNDLLNLYVDTPCVEYGSYGRFRSKSELRNLFQNIIPAASAWTFRVASFPLISINNSAASGNWREVTHVVQRANYAAGAQLAFARYNEQYQKTSAGWKFSSAVVTFDIPPTGP